MKEKQIVKDSRSFFKYINSPEDLMQKRIEWLMVFNRELLRKGFSNDTGAENSSIIWYKRGKITVTFYSITYVQIHVKNIEATSTKRFYTHECLSEALSWAEIYINSYGGD